MGAFSAAAKAWGATSSGDGGLAPGSPAGAGREGRSGAVPGTGKSLMISADNSLIRKRL